MLACWPGAGNAVTLSSKESLIPIPTQAAQERRSCDRCRGRPGHRYRRRCLSRRQARLSPSPSRRGVDPDRPVRCRQRAGAVRRFRRGVQKVSGLTVDALATRPASTSATLPPGPETRRCHDPDVRWSHTREPGRHQGHRRWGDRERAEPEPTPKYAGIWTTTFGPIRRKGSI